MIDDLQAYLVAGAAATVVAGAMWAATRFLPKLLAARLKSMFLRARASGWVTDANHPKRLEAYLAFLEWVEAEVPDRGDPGADAWFLEAGIWIAAHLPPIISGSPAGWAKALRALSDETDDGFDAEISTIRALVPPIKPQD